MAKKKQIKDIYVMRIDGVWCGYAPRKKCSFCIIGKKGDSLVDFFSAVKEDFPEYRLRCVLNYGIEEELRKVKSSLEERFYINRKTLTK